MSNQTSNQTTSSPVQSGQATRRQFLINSSAFAATVALAPETLAVPSREQEARLDRISLMDFARQLNTAFLVHLNNRAAVKLQLIEVRPLRTWPQAEDAGNEKFALLFRAPLSQALEQDTHAFEHDQLGRFGMFIVPIGCNDQTHCYYEAIFNRPPGGGQRAEGNTRRTRFIGPSFQ